MSREITALPALENLHSPDPVASLNAIDDPHSVDDPPDDGVSAIQMRLRRVRDEKLAAARVFTRESHPDCPAVVWPGVDLAADLIARAAFAVATRVAALNNEMRRDAVKSQAVEEAFTRERDEAFHRDR